MTNRLPIVTIALIACAGSGVFGQDTIRPPKGQIRGALLSAADIDANKLRELEDDGFTSVVVALESNSAANSEHEVRAARRVIEANLQLYYWIEVARCVELADAHPEWMASLQGHDEWRRFFPDAPVPSADEVTKTYPWVPILAREPFAAQLERVTRLLDGKPTPTAVFLNDLQGAPSACGCGNPLCRWTSDYGKKRTTVPLGDDAAALFVKSVGKSVPKSSIIPVWTTECEEHDGAKDGLCAGVGCFDGICWKAYTRQLAPLEQTCKTLAVQVPYRAFQRDTAKYGRKAGWIRHAVASFSKMPPRHGGKAIEPSRLVAVLQGWNVGSDEVEAQIAVADEAGVSGYIVAFEEIDQSWQPKIVQWQ